MNVPVAVAAVPIFIASTISDPIECAAPKWKNRSEYQPKEIQVIVLWIGVVGSATFSLVCVEGPLNVMPTPIPRGKAA